MAAQLLHRHHIVRLVWRVLTREDPACMLRKTGGLSAPACWWPLRTAPIQRMGASVAASYMNFI
jgi:hypothetical protein